MEGLLAKLLIQVEKDISSWDLDEGIILGFQKYDVLLVKVLK